MREHQIGPGVRGWLESPASDVIASDCLTVSGWAFVEGATIVDVWSTGFGARRPLQFGIRRDDVARLYAVEPGAVHSGFSGYLELDGQPGERVNFDIWARLDDGRSIQLFQRALVTRTPGFDGSAIKSAVRQVLGRPGLLLSGRTWLGAFRSVRQALSPPSVPTLRSATGKARLRRSTRAALAGFLAGRTRLTFARPQEPVVSAVVILWNHADLTLTALLALAAQTDVPFEVVIVDNASTDETPELLGRIDGATIVKNPGNLGFTASVNIGARAARGEFLLFLNNDAALEPGSIACLVETARRSPSIGAVGGKLVYPDGRLQEAGSIIWSDGSCEGYGRGGDPGAPEYNFERPVDFCSAALLLTRRSVFEQLGGFDERYRPSYYDDVDYCVRLWSSGYSVVYQPKAAAIHYEFGSTSPEASMEMQSAHRPIFVSTHQRWLASQATGEETSALEARSHPHGRPAVLVIDDAVPDPRLGAGFPRAAALVGALAGLGYRVTLYVTDSSQGSPSARADARRVADLMFGVELVPGSPEGLGAFLGRRRHHRLVVVSRPHNMQYVKAAIGSDLSVLGVPCVYDAEAIYALREIERRRLTGQPMPEDDGQALLAAEFSLARGCAAVLAVSEADRQVLAAAGVAPVFTLGHAIEPQPTPNAFENRRSLLFVGAFSHLSSNEDAVRWFCRDVLPGLRVTCRCDAPLVVAGAHLPDRLLALGNGEVRWRRDVDDLTALYDDARVFIAPTRYAAGISLKVIEAAARGVPVVCTPLVSKQLGWVEGVELLTAEDAAGFARAIATLYEDRSLWRRLRNAALERITRDYSAAGFSAALQDALAPATDRASLRHH